MRVVANGYDALKFDPFVMRPDGMSRAPERVLPREQANLAYERVKAVREAVGPGDWRSYCPISMRSPWTP